MGTAINKTMNSRILGWLMAVSSCWSVASAQKPDQVLFDFESNDNLSQVVATDAKVVEAKSADGTALRITTGHEQAWPGITLKAPGGSWDLSPYARVTLQVRNRSGARITVNCRVDNPGADGTRNCVTGSISLNPWQKDMLRVPLKRAVDSKLGGKLFGMRGYPVEYGVPGTIDAKQITQLLVFVTKPKEDLVFEIDEVVAGGIYTPPTASVNDAIPFFPFIDTFGQYLHKNWPGKTRSLEDMAAKGEAEAKALKEEPGPKDWDQYGGWASGPQLKATGFFRVEKHQGKWWLVDPEGRLFFSHGIDCVRMVDLTPVEERKTWFQDFPGDQPEYAPFFSERYSLKGHYAGRTPQCFAFSAVNLSRKYGPDWKQRYAEVIHKRLRSWGLNTIANWSDAGVYLMRRTPYTDTLGSRGAKMIEGSEGYWGKFPDVYDPSFAEGVRRGLEGKKGASANDPWCIGYFSDNEMSWGDETSLALAALKSPSTQAAKQEFIKDLRGKYGEIAKLNQAWGTTHSSWDALIESREAPDIKKAGDDLKTFYTRTAETYFRTVKEAIQAVAPNQLYLGCRFAWVNERAALAASQYCDVVSYNLYRRSVADFKYPGPDKPLIIGEFHFGALDRGMFHTGLVPTENQQERAAAYKNYVLGALQHPQFVGTHWFQYMDQPTTGRVLDEENYQIGFVDIADTPYLEMIQASRQVGYHLYR